MIILGADASTPVAEVYRRCNLSQFICLAVSVKARVLGHFLESGTRLNCAGGRRLRIYFLQIGCV